MVFTGDFLRRIFPRRIFRGVFCARFVFCICKRNSRRHFQRAKNARDFSANFSQEFCERGKRGLQFRPRFFPCGHACRKKHFQKRPGFSPQLSRCIKNRPGQHAKRRDDRPDKRPDNRAHHRPHQRAAEKQGESFKGDYAGDQFQSAGEKLNDGFHHPHNPFAVNRAAERADDSADCADNHADSGRGVCAGQPRAFPCASAAPPRAKRRAERHGKNHQQNDNADTENENSEETNAAKNAATVVKSAAKERENFRHDFYRRLILIRSFKV
ncbi:MAG: hypothetical protein MPK13_03840 [Gammaproteobacteria bacterium]|nr:hypothetical protein [Gammaproteobacteria bacterium]